jgi:hypothetical protein
MQGQLFINLEPQVPERQWVHMSSFVEPGVAGRGEERLDERE